MDGRSCETVYGNIHRLWNAVQPREIAGRIAPGCKVELVAGGEPSHHNKIHWRMAGTAACGTGKSPRRNSARPGSFEIEIAGLDYYPNAGRPRVLFAGVSPEPGLIRLAEAINEALAAIGCPREDRAYSPHLTLARIKNENIDKLRERIIHMPNIEFGSFEVREFHLYLSKTSSHGSMYSKLRTYATC